MSRAPSPLCQIQAVTFDMNTLKVVPTRHLDLGCGDKPRNPYGRDELYGIDIREPSESGAIKILQANIAIDPIPFPDNHFNSVSAYDFFEHVPRVLQAGSGMRFPFIELMNEVWRVLLPGARLYAYTPAYPHAAVFQDPTHVNFLARNSHIYFCRPELLAKMYGFVGEFEPIRVLFAKSGEFEYEPIEKPKLMRRLRVLRRELRNKNSHLVWEFAAIKPSER